MRPFVGISQAQLPEIISRGFHDQIAVFMDQMAAIRIDHIVEASFSVQAECQRSVFGGIPEAVLHFIAVSEDHRTRQYPLIGPWLFFIRLYRRSCLLQQVSDTFVFFLQLFSITAVTIKTASADSAEAAFMHYRIQICQITHPDHLRKSDLPDPHHQTDRHNHRIRRR